MQLLTIKNVKIRQDNQNRFCLNDLHKASGAQIKHTPDNWLTMKETIVEIQEYIGFSDEYPLKVFQHGEIQCTYVCKGLVYAYAMWIGSNFYTEVDEAFDVLDTALNTTSESINVEKNEALKNEKLKLLRLETVKTTLDIFLNVAKKLNCPIHYAKIEAVKEIKKQTGIDFNNILIHSIDQNNILTKEKMVEPYELWSILGFDDKPRVAKRCVNNLLCKAGLQNRVDGVWTPTKTGESCSVKQNNVLIHNEGFNYKWNVEKTIPILKNLIQNILISMPP